MAGNSEDKKSEDKKNENKKKSFNPYTLFLILILLIKSSEVSGLFKKNSDRREVL